MAPSLLAKGLSRYLFLLCSLSSNSPPFLTRHTAAAASHEVWQVGGRKLCEGKEVRYSECHNDPCGSSCVPRDCSFRPWSEWSAGFCTGLCERERGIAQTSNQCGTPCVGSLTQTKACVPHCHKKPLCGPEDVDCQWGAWTPWTACTSSCGGGQRTRMRDIAVHKYGYGEACRALTKSEAAGCNTQPCSWQVPCIDGKWSLWSAWGLCSASCGGGLYWRSRSIAEQPNECGKLPRGDDKEVRSCNSVPCRQGKVDCSFAHWSEWSDCSCSCSGVKHRTRVIDVFAKHLGNPCQGATKQVAPCNLSPGTPGCHLPSEPVDCAFSCWGDWGSCNGTSDCNSGQRIRQRHVALEAKNGGKVCEAGLSVIEPCRPDSCRESQTAKPCTWGVWSPWSPCDECGGSRKRFRRIEQLPQAGGAPCEPKASEEVQRCPGPSTCRFFCAWGEWADMGECSASCGTGTVRRIRHLEAEQAVTSGLQDDAISEIAIESGTADLQGRSDSAEPRYRHLLLLPGILGGGLTTLLAQWTCRRTVRDPEGAAAGHRRPWRWLASDRDHDAADL